MKIEMYATWKNRPDQNQVWFTDGTDAEMTAIELADAIGSDIFELVMEESNQSGTDTLYTYRRIQPT